MKIHSILLSAEAAHSVFEVIRHGDKAAIESADGSFIVFIPARLTSWFAESGWRYENIAPIEIAKKAFEGSLAKWFDWNARFAASKRRYSRSCDFIRKPNLSMSQYWELNNWEYQSAATKDDYL